MLHSAENIYEAFLFFSVMFTPCMAKVPLEVESYGLRGTVFGDKW